MNDFSGHREANVGRLLEAACGKEALLDPSLRERTRRNLIRRLHLRHSAPAFPERAVALLGFVLAGAATWLVLRVGGGGLEEAWRLPGLLIALPLSANLALVPVAAFVVLQRRRSDDQ
jgi:hypothetical protein